MPYGPPYIHRRGNVTASSLMNNEFAAPKTAAKAADIDCRIVTRVTTPGVKLRMSERRNCERFKQLASNAMN